MALVQLSSSMALFFPPLSFSILSFLVPFLFLSPWGVRERVGSRTGNQETAGRPESPAASLPRDDRLKGTLSVQPPPCSFFRGVFPALGCSL